MGDDGVDSRGLSVDARWDGRVLVLAPRGDLDAVTAGGFLARTAQAAGDAARTGAGPAERLVLDLAGLAFLDCAGARALAAVTRTVPGQYPVIVRSLSPAARRAFDLLGLNLEQPPRQPAAGRAGDHGAELIRRSQAIRSETTELRGRVAGMTEALAATEDRVAATMARIARQHPHRAARLTALSEQARGYATHIRHRLDDPGKREQPVPLG